MVLATTGQERTLGLLVEKFILFYSKQIKPYS